MTAADDGATVTAGAGPTLRRLVVPVYLPWLATGLALGVLVPVLPLYLRDAGLSLTATTAVLAAAGLGAALAGIPTSGLLARVGERHTLMLAVATTAGASAVSGFTTLAAVLFGLQFVVGAASMLSRLVHQTHVVRTVTLGHRGRALAGVGGTMRIAAFIGPLLGGVVAEQAGFRWAFIVAGALAAVGLVPASAPRDGVGAGGRRSEADTGEQIGIVAAIARHRRLLLRTALGPTLIMTVRFGRLVILPLIGDELDMTPTQVGLLVGISTGADLVLFPVAGVLMDRFGRLTAVVPAFSLMGLGLVLLAVADSSTAVVLAGAVIGVGNGLSAGSMLTISSDVAPADTTPQFIGAFATINDSGRFFGPLLVGWVGGRWGLDASALVLAVVMFVGVVAVVVLIGETRQPADAG